jgi:hypothetical protein
MFFYVVPVCYRKAWSFTPCNPDQPFFQSPKKGWTKKGSFSKSDSVQPTRFQNSLIVCQDLLWHCHSFRDTSHCALRTNAQTVEIALILLRQFENIQ